MKAMGRGTKQMCIFGEVYEYFRRICLISDVYAFLTTLGVLNWFLVLIICNLIGLLSAAKAAHQDAPEPETA